MEYETVSKGDFKVIGLTRRISNDNAQKEIPDMWREFIIKNYMENIPNKRSSNIMALYTDYEGDHTKPFLYSIGCEVTSTEEVPEGMNAIHVPGNKYALFTVTGGLPDSLIETWKYIWSTKDFTRKFEADFEVVKGPEEVLIYVSLK